MPRPAWKQFILDGLEEVIHGSRAYHLWMAALTFFMLLGTWAYSVQMSEGLSVTGMHDHVSWGLYISNFTFLVGVAAAAVILVMPAYVLKDYDFARAVLMGEAMAVAALVMAIWFVVVDVGGPARLWHMMPGLGLFNWPSSLLCWDIIVLNVYLALNFSIPLYLLYCRYTGQAPNKKIYVPMVLLSILWAVITTVTSCGAVNAFHDSFMPLAGMVPMVNMQLGESIFGGVGAGLYGMLMFAILAVFIAGLMVGRTPEYVGKKIESFEVKMAMLASLILAASILVFTGIASVADAGTATLNNPGAHGFSEILYLYTSSTANNGSAFAGIGANTLFYNTTGGLAMLFGRFLMIVPLLAIAGSLAAKRRVPPSLGTFPTTGGVWVGLLVGVILIMGALTFFPALSLGPIVEHFQLVAGLTFPS